MLLLGCYPGTTMWPTCHGGAASGRHTTMAITEESQGCIKGGTA